MSVAEGGGILPVAVLPFILAGSRHYNKPYSDGQADFILEITRWFSVKRKKKKKKEEKKEKGFFSEENESLKNVGS